MKEQVKIIKIFEKNSQAVALGKQDQGFLVMAYDYSSNIKKVFRTGDEKFARDFYSELENLLKENQNIFWKWEHLLYNRMEAK